MLEPGNAAIGQERDQRPLTGMLMLPAGLRSPTWRNHRSCRSA